MGRWSRILLGAVLLGAPAVAQAQSPVVLRGGADEARLTPSLEGLVPLFPLTRLAVIGASLSGPSPERLRITLFGDTLELETGSPFVRAGDEVLQLTSPVRIRRGEWLAPRDFFLDLLPSHFAGRLRARGDTLGSVGAVVAGRGAREGARPGGAVLGTPVASQRLVVLDAGHGGRDHGAVGRRGVREKDVALGIVTRLAAELRARGYDVRLTRTTDTLIALADRPRLANQWKGTRAAALFVSVHTNAHPNRAAKGFETYFLSEARTDDERRVAAMENAAVQYENNGSTESLDDIGFILRTLRNDFYLRASNDFAEVIQRRLDPLHPGPNRGVKQAGFRVLLQAMMPAVLVETAYISNAEEERLLATGAFQQNVAFALAEAIEEFFVSHEHLWTADATQ
ncbi:MAG: N-acetylmuramoyl-L-alanine amidase family protein [Longimicrobiales bacterium]